MLCCHGMLTLHRLANVLYPPACPRCDRSLPRADAALCRSCEGAMPRPGRPLCLSCGIGLSGAFDARLVCARCRARPPAFAGARAPWLYLGAGRQAIRLLKYRHRRRLGRWLAETMAHRAGEDLPVAQIDLVVPVPLHWLTRRLRGANHAAELSARVASALHKPHDALALRRRRWTPSQTRQRTWQERWRNVRESFQADPRRVQGQGILLVDDVLTTGATAQACAQALRAAGSREVFVLTAARTPLQWRTR